MTIEVSLQSHDQNLVAYQWACSYNHGDTAIPPPLAYFSTLNNLSAARVSTSALVLPLSLKKTTLHPISRDASLGEGCDAPAA